MTTTDTALVFAPQAPHPASLEDPRLTISDATGTVIAHFCPRNRCGAVYDLRSRAWTMYSPMTASEFLSALPKLGVRIADTAALQVWIDSISQQPPIGGRH